MKNKGVTLIALIVTVIVLLILIGIIIGILTGENRKMWITNIHTSNRQELKIM